MFLNTVRFKKRPMHTTQKLLADKQNNKNNSRQYVCDSEHSAAL